MASSPIALIDVWAASRSLGLPWKAMPCPAFCNMSRSLAPSPMAITWSSGTPSRRASSSSRSALRCALTMGPTTRPVSFPSSISSVFDQAKSMPSRCCSASAACENPPEMTAVR